MKGESGFRGAGRPARLSRADAEETAVAVLDRLVGDPERLGRFFALSGLDPGSIRRAAGEPGFLPSVLDHVAGDEDLLLAIAGELDVKPERLMAARQLLSPEPGWEP